MYIHTCTHFYFIHAYVYTYTYKFIMHMDIFLYAYVYTHTFVTAWIVWTRRSCSSNYRMWRSEASVQTNTSPTCREPFKMRYSEFLN